MTSRRMLLITIPFLCVIGMMLWAHAQDTATITTVSGTSQLSLDMPKAEAYGTIKVKGFGVDFVYRRAQVVGAYYDVDGNEGDGFTVDITDSTTFSTFVATCNSQATLLKMLAKAKTLTVK